MKGLSHFVQRRQTVTIYRYMCIGIRCYSYNHANLRQGSIYFIIFNPFTRKGGDKISEVLRKSDDKRHAELVNGNVDLINLWLY